MPLSRAPIVPPTWVPWPSSSLLLREAVQLVQAWTLQVRVRVVAGGVDHGDIDVNLLAAASMSAVEFASASMRSTPVGRVCS